MNTNEIKLSCEKALIDLEKAYQKMKPYYNPDVVFEMAKVQDILEKIIEVKSSW